MTSTVIVFKPVLGFLNNNCFDKKPLLSRFSSLETIERINYLNLQYYIFDIRWGVIVGNEFNGLPIPYDLIMKTPPITTKVISRLEEDYYETNETTDPLEMRMDLVANFVEKYCLSSVAIEEYYKRSNDFKLF